LELRAEMALTAGEGHLERREAIIAACGCFAPPNTGCCLRSVGSGYWQRS
jgi:hypothetical protein